MSDYTIAAIPTVYNGRQYRSRLEARWAAFFDWLGWRHEYEPYDLGSWSPDFLLPDLHTLVEVKPTHDITRTPDVWDKIDKARPVATGVGWLWTTTVSPIRVTEDFTQVGWISVAVERQFPVLPACIAWIPEPYEPVLVPDLLITVHPDLWFCGRGYEGSFKQFRGPVPYPQYLMKGWAEASNAVQWRPDE